MKTHPKDYSDDVWNGEMKKENLTVKMKAEKFKCLRTTLTYQYHNMERMECANEAKLAALHQPTLSSYYQGKIRVFLQRLRKACILMKDRTKEQDLLQAILDTQTINDILTGTEWKEDWVSKPW